MPPAFEDRPGLSLDLYRQVYRIRRAEEAIVERYLDDEMKTPCHLSLGQEAIAAAVCHALSPQDRVVGSYRSHALYLARTGDLDGFFAELYGRVSGVCKGRAGSMHLGSAAQGHLGSSAVVGTYIPLGVGAALAHRITGSDAWVAVFLGDGATDEGVFFESVNFAALHGLRVMFVCEDNGLAIHSFAHDRRGFDRIADIVSAYRCEVVESQSTVAEELYAIVVAARARAEAAGTPAFFNFKCYRYVEHVGISPDFHHGYRDEASAAPWKDRDPAKVQRARAVAAAGEAAVVDVEGALDEAIRVAIARARAAPFPATDDICADLFTQPGVPDGGRP